MFHKFKYDLRGVELPERFNNPFHYLPHQLCVVAERELRICLTKDPYVFAESFMGKMYGVLVVQAPSGEIGYLMAFSGLLTGKNTYEGFVPPVYDMQQPDGYFKQEEACISAINAKISKIEESDDYISAVKALETEREKAKNAVAEMSALFKANKEERKRRREAGFLSQEDEAQMVRQSQFEKAELKRTRAAWDAKIAEKESAVALFTELIETLGAERAERSAALQKWLFGQFKVLNAKGESKSLLEIFDEKLSVLPPAGAGECAAPKLLQYAYANSLKPLAMGEFWVGRCPERGEVRRDGCYYGACKSKCEPILQYMLQGLDVEDSALEKGGDISNVEIVYEDEHLLVVNKPAGILSVPGIVGGMSVEQWIREEYLHRNDIFVVHRLDMSTSGLLIVAKSVEVYKSLQNQFLKRTVVKEYTAILEGVPVNSEGTIDLPLASDYENRPCQIVDHKNGKLAVTNYNMLEIIQYKGKQCSLVRFNPVTGRTHQLRVHAASPQGLDCPIVGDALYGTNGDRLMLHASSLTFDHPVSGKRLVIECKACF